MLRQKKSFCIRARKRECMLCQEESMHAAQGMPLLTVLTVVKKMHAWVYIISM